MKRDTRLGHVLHPDGTQTSLFEVAAEGRAIVTDIFDGHTVRVLEIDGQKWTPAVDLYKAANIAKQMASRSIKKIQSTFPDCTMVSLGETIGETAPTLVKREFLLLNPEGVSHFFHGMDLERIQDPDSRERIIRFRSWVAKLVGGVLSGETEKATVQVVAKHISQYSPDELLQVHMNIAKILATQMNADLPVLQQIAIGEAEKYSGMSLQPYQKALPGHTMEEIGYLIPTQLGKIWGKSNRTMNKILERMGMQVRDNGGWIPSDLGKNHCLMYPYARNGHTAYQLKWKESITPLIEKFLQAYPEH